MKVLIAPDSFKESLSAADVSAALGEGVLGLCGGTQIDLCPMADGGEGTVEAVVAATGGRFVFTEVYDPLGSSIRARFGLVGPGAQANLPGELGLAAAEVLAEGQGDLAGGGTAVIEMAAASGLGLVGPADRDPFRTTTFGTGQLILAALDAGVSQIIIGIGGSATVDGGCGCAQGLGVTFVRQDGQACVCGMGGGALGDLGSIDMSDRDRRLEHVRIRVACDVTNPLTGPSGAAAIYGPQKGATAEMVEQLDAGLGHLAEVIRRDVGVEVLNLPGGGAAGGLGAGLVAFTGATLERGVDLVAQAVGLQRRLGGVDLCITGEGKFDAQSGAGKTVSGVAQRARAAGVPVICIAGQVSDDAPVDLLDDVLALVDGETTAAAAIRDPQPLLKALAAKAMKAFLSR